MKPEFKIRLFEPDLEFFKVQHDGMYAIFGLFESQRKISNAFKINYRLCNTPEKFQFIDDVMQAYNNIEKLLSAEVKYYSKEYFLESFECIEEARLKLQDFLANNVNTGFQSDWIACKTLAPAFETMSLCLKSLIDQLEV